MTRVSEFLVGPRASPPAHLFPTSSLSNRLRLSTHPGLRGVPLRHRRGSAVWRTSTFGPLPGPPPEYREREDEGWTGCDGPSDEGSRDTALSIELRPPRR